MRNPALIAITVLCSFATSCPSHNDTTAPKEWPQFSSSVDAPAPDVECPLISSRKQAVRLFSVCMDKSIAALKAFAERDPVAMSDLAAAYYFRASRQDKPEDYLNAYDAAEHAMNQTPQPKWAAGNMKVIEKALGLDSIAPAAFDPSDPKSIERYPGSALLYLESELLPERIAEARRLATQLVHMTGDRYPLDEVEACAAGGPALKAAHAMFGAALRRTPGASFSAAAAQLRQGDSPASLHAAARAANAAEDVAALGAIAEDAHKRGYLDLQAWALSARANRLLFRSSYLDALDNYEEALRIYERLHNPERIALTHTRLIGVRRVAGQLDQGWRESLQAAHDTGHVAAPTERNLRLGEIAAMANALHHPRAALRYADTAVRLVQRDKQNLGIALRRRATYELRVNELAKAQADFNAAVRLAAMTTDPEDRRSLEARLAEVQAQLATRVDPAHAPEAFTRALALSDGLEYRSFRASLYAQRAAAERTAGKENDAETDLRNALAELDAEESNLLATRKEIDPEKLLWNDYFSRFQETYHDLIRYQISKKRGDEAFKYADRARAFEPLNLALKLTPENAAPVDLGQIQKLLPSGTFLIEYTVLDDRTFAWVITDDAWQVLDLKAGKAKIERWSEQLQSAVPIRDLDTIDTTLLAAYDDLLTAPLAAIQHMPSNAAPRLVIVPDGTMESIPFAALRNPASRRYLIQDAPVSIAGSAALYALSVKRDRELKRDVSALLVGNPQPGPALLGAENEVKEIAKLYAPHATVRIGADATIDDFLARAGNSAIVHVGAHAVIDPHVPSHSRLLFASGELDAAQLLARFKSIRTRLVVLGACSSAGGLPVGPQGVAPLVRPLIARGVPAVVGTLWDVEDATAAELLVSFHQHYKEGNDAAVAMQLAQLDLLGNQNVALQSVLAWAPYQVIGHGSSPFAAPRH